MSMKWLTGSSSNPRRNVRRILAVSLCTALIFTSGCSLLPKEDTEEVLPVVTKPNISKKPEYEVVRGTITDPISANGKLMSEQEEALFFTDDRNKDTNKRIKAVHVKAGQKVAAGQVIAELDVENLEKDLRKKRLNFRKQELEMKKALRTKEQMEEGEFEQAQIVFEEARNDIADAEKEIAKAKLVAPFAGTVVTLNAQKGAVAKLYETMAIVADTSRLAVTVSVTKDDLKKINIGMDVDVDINKVGKTLKGKVKMLPAAQNDQNGGNGGNGGVNGQERPEKLEDFLIVQLDKMPSGLNRGDQLGVKIITKQKVDAVIIPPAALRSIGPRTYVQVVDDKGAKREVDVEVGMQTSTEVEIVKGLTPGQKVVGR